VGDSPYRGAEQAIPLEIINGGQQTTDTIVPFRINQANGMLTPTGQVIKTNSPCTIVFAGA
jgi:6-phosphogluconolactonase (cycloisomerase 2 family)